MRQIQIHKILVVDDSRYSRDLAIAALRMPGYEFSAIDDGLRAVAEAELFAPDLVLMDIQMPILDGYGALAALRAMPRFRQLRVIAATAHALASDRDRVSAAGFNGFVPKPLSAALLRSVVAEMRAQS